MQRVVATFAPAGRQTQPCRYGQAWNSSLKVSGNLVIIIMIITMRMKMKMAMDVNIMSKKQTESSVERAGDGDGHNIIL